MKAKTKIGMDMKSKKKMTTRKRTMKKRILPIAKRGGALLFLPILNVFGFLIGGMTNVAKVINNRKAVRCQLEELQCHAIE